jgi:hypothetical protein
MRRAQESSGWFRTLSSLAFLAALIFVAIKIFPAYVNNFRLQGHIQQLSTKLAVRTWPVTSEEVRDEVVAFAQDHGVSLAADNVKVTVFLNYVSIKLDYTVPVDLKVYTLMLHFTPSTEKRSL